jgi:hypothetical protein
MQITIDIEKFAHDPKGLTNMLYYIRKSGNYFNPNSEQIEAICCRTPSSAYRYTKLVSTSGITEKSERVFLKNPNIGIRYLTKIRQAEFKSSDTQRRFWKKVIKNSQIAYEWAREFKKRLSETEEEIFADDFRLAKEYARNVIKGPFPEKIHNILLLKSFEKQDGWRKNCLQDYIRFAESCK